MANIEKFEDIKSWQQARELCKLIHSYTLKDLFSRDYRLARSKDLQALLWTILPKGLNETEEGSLFNSYR